MNAQAILNKIEENARDTAQNTVAQAQAKAEELKNASRVKIEEMHRTLLSQAERDGEALEQRMLRMAELDERKELLAKKRALMDEAFALAGARLSAVPASEKRAFFLKKLLAVASDGETLVIGAKNAEWFDERFFAEANEALKKAGKTDGLTLAAEKREGCEGFTLCKGGVELRCTFDALLDEARSLQEQQMVEDLFGKA
jgi:V/A-type H+/Na+-transporting ATPase subunit E